MVETDSMFGAEGLRAFTASLVDARMLDGLSEYDADTVAMLVTLDFTQGPKRMAWRLTDWLNRRQHGRPEGRQHGCCGHSAGAVLRAGDECARRYLI